MTEVFFLIIEVMKIISKGKKISKLSGIYHPFCNKSFLNPISGDFALAFSGEEEKSERGSGAHHRRRKRIGSRTCPKTRQKGMQRRLLGFERKWKR